MKQLKRIISASFVLTVILTDIAMAGKELFVTIDCNDKYCTAKLWERGWLSNTIQQTETLKRKSDGSFVGTGKGGVTLRFSPNRDPMWFLIRGKDGTLKMPFGCAASKDDVDYVCLMAEYTD
ncbi:hypothetical protein [Thiocystis violascens]|uniref:hypothetical protein n=1 Tax=Thiocystis violascens TaxID=73141 RepID=UPI0012F6337B|nr:hypothetical protein [Thiocystis violascens]